MNKRYGEIKMPFLSIRNCSRQLVLKRQESRSHCFFLHVKSFIYLLTCLNFSLNNLRITYAKNLAVTMLTLVSHHLLVQERERKTILETSFNTAEELLRC